MQKIITRITLVLLTLITFCDTKSFAYQASSMIPENGKIYVNSTAGTNTNEGTLIHPLQTLGEAAKRINNAKGTGTITVYISKGTYALVETVDFNPVNWQFTEDDRLIIQAEITPDDKEWNPADMPVVFSAMPFIAEKNKNGEITGAQNFGILIQTSHVTIKGLRILGEPVHENPSKGMLVRNYPIVWEGKNLEDLRITQCLFIGDKHSIPNHLAILANGKFLEVDHCVFFGVKDAVVMWNNPASQSSMHHNLIIDSYGAVVWTWSATEDFKFYNNAISNSNVIWVFDEKEKFSYNLQNSIIVGYNSIVNKGGGPQGFGEKGDPAKLKMDKSVVIRKSGKLEIISDQTSKFYLHIKPGTLGSDLGAGLFSN